MAGTTTTSRGIQRQPILTCIRRNNMRSWKQNLSIGTVIRDEATDGHDQMRNEPLKRTTDASYRAKTPLGFTEPQAIQQAIHKHSMAV